MMMDHEPERSLRETGDILIERVSGLSYQIASLQAAIRRNRNVVRFLTVSLVFDIVLSLGLAYATHRALTATDEAKAATDKASAAIAANAEAIRVGCLSANETRAQDLAMWNGLVALFPPATTQEGRQRVENILRLAAETFAPKDC